ncbi:MAG: single-stranded DNA-binding protein [Acidimicrobiia bacterium]
MDLNLVVLAGRVVAPPEARETTSGERMVRYLIATARDRPPARLDVIPVTVWSPERSGGDTLPAVGGRVWVTGSVQRRFHGSVAGRRSVIEVVAGQVACRPEDDAAAETV